VAFVHLDRQQTNFLLAALGGDFFSFLQDQVIGIIFSPPTNPTIMFMFFDLGNFHFLQNFEWPAKLHKDIH